MKTNWWWVVLSLFGSTRPGGLRGHRRRPPARRSRLPPNPWRRRRSMPQAAVGVFQQRPVASDRGAE